MDLDGMSVGELIGLCNSSENCHKLTGHERDFVGQCRRRFVQSMRRTGGPPAITDAQATMLRNICRRVINREVKP